jgi:ATP-dependent 26S proteasome regulatory subunit
VKYVGEGEKLVRAVFSLARKLSPCVVFLDEIDALFGARMSARESGSAFAHRGVITEFMQEMDGLKSSKEHNVIVIGATNRPFDLDDAVLRRLPRRLLVDLPGEKEREGGTAYIVTYHSNLFFFQRS